MRICQECCEEILEDSALYQICECCHAHHLAEEIFITEQIEAQALRDSELA